MIYLDASVVLAYLLVEDHAPADAMWDEQVVSSRLLEYEVWNRIHARRLTRSHGESAREVLGRVELLELSPPVVQRALDPFPVAVRTLDALHLATVEYCHAHIGPVRLATYDRRLADAAKALKIPLEPLP